MADHNHNRDQIEDLLYRGMRTEYSNTNNEQIYILLMRTYVTLAMVLSWTIMAVDIYDYRVFNWNFYLNHNKDLLRAGHNDEAAARAHWSRDGVNQGRQAHPKFHSRQYCDLYEDLRKAGLCKAGGYIHALTHYIEHGIQEGRQGYVATGAYGMWVVTNPVLTVTASALHGGAVSSILYQDRVEIVNSYDRGRQLQYAFTDSTGECNNPTEGGSGKDGIGDTSTSVLHGIRAVPGQYIATTTQPAYWKGPPDPCTQGRGWLSPFMVAKQVTINYMNNANLIAYDISFKMARDFDVLSFECPTLYMPATFDHVYTIDIASRTYQEIPLPADWKVEATLKPIMYSNAEGVAVGVIFKMMHGITGVFRYAYFGKMGSAHPIDHTTKWSAWFHTGSPVAANTAISSRMYIAIGTKAEVVNALATP